MVIENLHVQYNLEQLHWCSTDDCKVAASITSNLNGLSDVVVGLLQSFRCCAFSVTHRHEAVVQLNVDSADERREIY